MYDNYIFDFYGTLVDIRTNEDKYYLWKKMSELYSSLGAAYSPAELKREFRRLEREEKLRLCEKAAEEKKLDEKILKEKPQEAAGCAEVDCSCVEPDLRAVFAKLYANKGEVCGEEIAGITAVMFRTLSRQRLQAYAGVKQTLAELRRRGKGVYLLSNAQKDFTRPELELLGLRDCFDGILLSSEEGWKKPSGLFFQRLLERYQLRSESCLMVGNDEYTDILGARGVGMDSLYVQTETSPRLREKSAATYCVPDGDWQKVAAILLGKA